MIYNLRHLLRLTSESAMARINVLDHPLPPATFYEHILDGGRQDLIVEGPQERDIAL